MKITDAKAIQTGEKDLMDAILRDLDWAMIEETLKTKYSLNLGADRMAFRQGDLVVHQNQVAYKLDFDVQVTLSVMVDRKGECFDVVTTAAEEKSPTTEASSPAAAEPPAAGPEHTEDAAAIDPAPDSPPAPAPAEASPFITSNMDTSRMASEIADLIADINRS
ncbi:hypothetical protein [Desulfosudis oleivorans]|uniref:Uncharacterized protein n=1 Tax=Desulfosudis oleivorans (strain DSM 6200 / JCM 39069 / Hxd3) TaxID=96561 RepID=A8ZY69_DESOH|nr:hypothetical protein [Desulfosudis oleivorans]ABW67076.1 hypothetical protein Dole_1270 [Desulfosudis oleivorans Hxd3]